MGSLPVRFVDMLLKGDLKSSSEHNNAIVLSVLHRELIKEELTIPYDRIASFVYKNEQSDEENEKLNEAISYLVSEFTGSDADKKILERNLDKIKNNYTLSQLQKSFITHTTKDLQNLMNSLVPVVSTLEDQTNESKKQMERVTKEVEDVKETKSGIYTDFIAILGVFSAFVFLMFGGIEVVRVIFDVADDLATLSLSRLILLASLMLLVVLTLLYSLLLWIARITGKKFGNCPCEECQVLCKHKYIHAFYRHSFFFSLMVVLAILVVLGHSNFFG